jgi:tetratricopeptide (TPR) repeat protein
MITLLKMNRPDLAEQTLRQLKAIDEDNSLTILSHCWLQIYRSGVQSSLDELIVQLNQMSERFGGYTTKTYNLLALTLMEKQDYDRALKIFENALNELKLDSEEG